MKLKKLNKRDIITRVIVAVIGVFFIGLAVAIFQSVHLGNDPFSCMNTGISTFIGWKFGMLQLTVNVIIFIPTILFMREAIGFGTVFNMVFVGIFADLLRPIFIFLMKAFNNNMVARIIFLIISVLVICLGVALYISADTGMAPYDALAYILEKYTKINFSWFRIMTDVICVVIGLIFGYKAGIQWQIVGIGTIITAFGTGPIVRFFQNKVADPLIKKINPKQETKAKAGERE